MNEYLFGRTPRIPLSDGISAWMDRRGGAKGREHREVPGLESRVPGLLKAKVFICSFIAHSMRRKESAGELLLSLLAFYEGSM